MSWCVKIFIMLACACLVSLLPAWNGDATGTSPAIHFEKDVFTFEPILEGESVDVSFRFTNLGEEVLVIHDTVTSCGCTTAHYPTHSIGSNGATHGSSSLPSRSSINPNVVNSFRGKARKSAFRPRRTAHRPGQFMKYPG